MSEVVTHDPVWLVWSLNIQGLTILHAVDTSQELAERHRKLLLEDAFLGQATIRAWIDKVDTNHFYASLFFAREL